MKFGHWVREFCIMSFFLRTKTLFGGMTANSILFGMILPLYTFLLLYMHVKSVSVLTQSIGQ